MGLELEFDIINKLTEKSPSRPDPSARRAGESFSEWMERRTAELSPATAESEIEYYEGDEDR